MYVKDKSMSKKAFTLAEVLITLTILGVVAVLTIRTAIIKTQEREVVAKVLKAYSQLDNAFETYKVINGGLERSVNFSNDGRVRDIYNHIISPNFKIIRDCGTTGQGCMAIDGGFRQNYACKTLDGRDLVENRLAPCTASNWLWNWEGTYYRVLTANNIGIAIQSLRGTWTTSAENFGNINGDTIIGLIAVDVNGPKAPNTLGRDIFMFGLTNKGVFPYPMDRNNCDINNKTRDTINGAGCTDFIIRNKNMNYLRR